MDNAGGDPTLFLDLQVPIFFGVVLSVFLLGITWCQSATYFQRYARTDTWVQLAIVAALLELLTAKGAVDIWALYRSLITPFNPLSPLGTPTEVGLVLGFPVTVLPQMWLLYRVKTITKNWWIIGTGGALITLSTASFLGYIVVRLRTFNAVPAERALELWFPLFAWSTTATFTYLSISFSACAYWARKSALSPRFGMVLGGLSVVAMKACLPTAVLAASMAITVTCSPHTTAYAALEICYTYTAVISVLFTLNSRKSILELDQAVDTQLPQTSNGTLYTSGHSRRFTLPGVEDFSNMRNTNVPRRYEVGLDILPGASCSVLERAKGFCCPGPL